MHPWLVRLSWLAVPFTIGAAIAGALDDRSSAVQSTAAGILWAGWALVVLGTLVPRPAGLVALRVATAAAAVITVWAADSGADWAVAGVHALVALVLALAPQTGEWLVNGTSYGYERRYLLRPPAPLLAGPLPLAALFLLTAVLAGPLLLAAEQWAAGGMAAVVSVPVGTLLARSLHSMTLRWAVLVPAGLVVKDHLALRDPVLFRRTDIDVLQPAPADSDALDLTAGAPGAPLELHLREKQTVERIRLGRRDAELLNVQRLRFTPTRPVALLAGARSRRIRVLDGSRQ